MKQVVGLEVPLGYILADKINNVKIWDAEKILITKKQRYYTKAVRKGTDAELFSSYIICPHCGREFVLNTKYSTCGYHWYPGRRIPDEKVQKWSSTQLSFFEGKREKVLYMSSPVDNLSLFKCPECENISEHSDRIKHVSMTTHNKKISIKSEITNIKEIMGFKWLGENSVTVVFPMYEVITFNLGKGRIHIKLEDENGIIQWQRDVTAHPEMLEGSVANNLIINNKLVNRNLKRMFMSIWKCNLPYTGKLMTMTNLFKMTVFVGYSQDFYCAVPYELDSTAIDSSFKEIASKIHYANSIVALFEESDLPKVKSVRRVFFNNPALFFYVKEAEIVWQSVNDLNIFCNFLKMENAFEMLSDIHTRPGIIEYINDFCKIKGPGSFLKQTQISWRCMLGEAIEYVCANKSVREIIQQSWSGEESAGRIVKRRPVYSIPMHCPEEGIADCSIDGYDFFWLRNSNEYACAGKQLNNCLSTWTPDSCPVVCVKKQDKYVAAIEVFKDKIVQAKGYDNSQIVHDTALGKALSKWQKKYNIEWFDEDYDEFLPDMIDD